jgi:cytochrome c peroxidase
MKDGKMKLEIGKTLPEATFLRRNDKDEVETISLRDLTDGKTVVLFALPGAYTATCSAAHMPSFVRTAIALRANGVDTIACIAVNDPAVMRAWGQDTGAHDAGILMLSDADGSYTRAVGMDYDAPATGLYGRSKRYSLLVRDGVIEQFNFDEERGVCNLSAGETMLDQL